MPPKHSEIVDLIARHLPPSTDRVRVRALDAPARDWVNALVAEYDAEMCDDRECDAVLATDLALLPQVSLRPGGRAIFLLPGETRSLPDLAAFLSAAGLTHILTEPALDGACILARGELPASAPDRSAAAAALGTELTVVPAGQRLPRYLHVLVHQQPPSRGWEQPDPASITWHAVTVRDRANGQSLLLGFSSLVKAVGFMKPAVLAGAIPDVNKLPRYRGESVAGWGMPVLVNPSFEALCDGAQYEFGSPPLHIDPRLEDKVRE